MARLIDEMLAALFARSRSRMPPPPPKPPRLRPLAPAIAPHVRARRARIEAEARRYRRERVCFICGQRDCRAHVERAIAIAVGTAVVNNK